MTPTQHNNHSIKTVKFFIYAVILCFYSLNSAQIIAQTNQATQVKSLTVKGKITDTDGMPLPGAAIINTTTKASVNTNIDGEFTIESAINDMLEISFLGMKSQNVTVTGLDTIEIALTDSGTAGNTNLAAYPAQAKATATNKPLKFNMPDANFFSNLMYYVSTKVKE
ncbi:hypothetical protein GR160_00275 [Flavobacterium sp. Sd200]|uniref:carboxypeptidase-like regulatory domain-containing protein n=1 Tax=Flavobacterium sp. Sd200 TaxID=2692211 RepID=UPI001367A258|nr:carboxypeptidase-like regulatory domain-containing protein [Flavobacterium sp. Sd200]MXN89650.1 hypothetical protein [Flavobacterium sp. Sd200]